ncbi:uncharacterized protein LOC132284866 [Cornus florida]|uniref:uncharacterized protein LOC132284866 n=1 Tax=Cornus florida TaxID=4283 RepID=UPI00289FBDB9|nr:uncharacterized protein LOC132284866 [Cornus florida]
MDIDWSDTSSSLFSDSDEDFDDLVDCMYLNLMQENEDSFKSKVPKRTSGLTSHEYVQELLNDHASRCFDLLRMDREVFLKLCRILREHKLLEDTHTISILESVAMFLFIIGHNIRHVVVAERFQHSGETVSRHFKRVLRAICHLGKFLIRSPQSNDVPSHILHNPKYYPWFKNCIGAIDRTHISVFAPVSKQTPYRGKKSIVTQNVMCVCSFDMLFTFVYAGWEGTANDSRVFIDAITRAVARFPIPPDGITITFVNLILIIACY